MAAHWFPPHAEERVSPAILPRAHTACSHTVMWGEDRSSTKGGMAPPSTTAWVCSEVPEAMLVRAQAASNCKQGWGDNFRNSTSLGMRPASTINFRGGFFSWDSIFLCKKKRGGNIMTSHMRPILRISFINIPDIPSYQMRLTSGPELLNILKSNL